MHNWVHFTHILIYLISTTWGIELQCLTLCWICHPIPHPHDALSLANTVIPLLYVEEVSNK